MGICYVIGAGDFGDGPLEPGTEDLVIAGDGGFRHCRERGIRVDLAIGDFDSLGYRPEAPEVVALVPEKDDTDMVAAVEEGIRRGEKILFTRDTHETDYLNTQEGKKLPVPHCIRGTGGWEIVEPLQKYAEHPIDKPTFGSQYLGALLKARDEDLRRQGEPGVEQVTLVGLCTDICVISNALLVKAFLPEAEVVVDAACCAGVTPESHRAALAAMGPCQITVENET